MADPMLAMDPLPLLGSAGGGACLDWPGWTNGRGKTCSDYTATYCAAGALRPEFAWLGGDFLKYPEHACCACGGGTSHAPPPPPAQAMTVHGYVLHVNSFCRNADRDVKKASFAECEAHCSSRKCACAHFANGECKFSFTFFGLLLSREGVGSNAITRPGSELEEAAVRAAAAEERAKHPEDRCGPLPARHVPPIKNYTERVARKARHAERSVHNSLHSLD